LIETLDALNIDRAHVYGTDMGAVPALLAAGAWPERFGGVAVSNSLLYLDLPASLDIALMRKSRLQPLVFNALPGLVWRRFLTTFLPAGKDLPEDVAGDMSHCFHQPAIRAQILDMCRAWEEDLPVVSKQFTRADLVLWADQDHHFPLAHGEQLAKRTDATLRVLPQARHWMWWTKAEQVANELVACFERCSWTS
jgi:pimeloyl-ACP methyl ester carboxylesterase